MLLPSLTSELPTILYHGGADTKQCHLSDDAVSEAGGFAKASGNDVVEVAPVTIIQSEPLTVFCNISNRVSAEFRTMLNNVNNTVSTECTNSDQ